MKDSDPSGFIAFNVINKNSNDMKEEIDNILEGFHLGKYDLLEVRKQLLILFNVSRSAYQDKLLKKADDMKESGKIWHSNKIYTDGIDCALDNMKKHIKTIGN